MFGWLKDKQIKEQKKLLFQNSAASKVLAGFYLATGDSANGARMEAHEEQNRLIALSVDEDAKIDAADLKIALDINQDLRKHHQRSLPMNGPFDEIYRPMLGWDKYFE
ncbi:MAG: hypothetical protein J0I42_18870 [Bosea sp.]|uniref:hypothetical protein n=1 Tax=Bosea sp. (in: a-proteobacteria) TaxID=1871050 RepID=UPI001ACA6186|nr:hypothetical protein [Bosea sp. (in: a-proteobacteria)]MBN9454005.1 hypothetical protein [Bosea sp. (in: a-proteobacteria)]